MLNNFSFWSGNSDFLIIKMIQIERKSRECFYQRNFLGHNQIIFYSLVNFVGLDSNNNNQISSSVLGMFIPLSWDDYFFLIRKTYVDWNFNFFWKFFDSLSLTRFTHCFFIDDFSFSSALITIALRLGVHAWSELYHFDDHSLSFTIFTHIDFFNWLIKFII